MHLDAAEPVEQVGAEQPVRNEPAEAAIRRRDDAHVDAPPAGAADPLDGEVLDGTQELGLRRQGEVGHLVQEQRAAIGVLELAAPPPHAGCGAILDAEQLGLEQRLDQRRAVDGDERAVPAPAARMNLPGHQFLARRRSRPR